MTDSVTVVIAEPVARVVVGMTVARLGVTDPASTVLKGDAGASAYDVAVVNGFVGTEAEWLETLKGDPGTGDGSGVDGASAYDVAIANGFVGTEAEWLASLVGPEGPQGPAGADGADGAPGADGATGSDGTPGSDGASAYDVAVAGGFVGTEAEWLASLVGPEGPQGPAGDDADVTALAAEVDALSRMPPTAVAETRALALADRNTCIETSVPVSIPAAADVAFAAGDVLSIYNATAAAVAITPAAGVTLRHAGTTDTGARTLAGYGLATLRLTGTADVWTIVGAGVS